MNVSSICGLPLPCAPGKIGRGTAEGAGGPQGTAPAGTGPAHGLPGEPRAEVENTTRQGTKGPRGTGGTQQVGAGERSQCLCVGTYYGCEAKQCISMEFVCDVMCTDCIAVRAQ